MIRKVKEAASVQEYIHYIPLEMEVWEELPRGRGGSPTPSGHKKPPGQPSFLGNHRDPYIMNTETHKSLRRQSLAKSLKKIGQSSDTTHTSNSGLGNKMALGSGDMASNLRSTT